jgi:acetyl esterase
MDFYETVQLLMIVILVLTGCQTEKPQKYIPASARKREKYATPEPGTYLKPVAYAVLKEINRVMEKPEPFKEPPDWVRKMFVARQKMQIDTVVGYHGLSVPVRIYYPTRKSLSGNQPVILFLHGGGFVMGGVDEYHIMVSKLARKTDQIIVSVEYHLAPEFPFPAGLNDCWAVFCWLQEHAKMIGADPKRIFVMGDSAGGNLATVLTLRCRDEGRAQPRCQVLLYPGVSFVDTLFPSREYFGLCEEMSYVLTEGFLRTVKSQYMGAETNDRLPYLSPLEAKLTADLAPALIITAECDPIRDDGRLYAKKLEAAGVEVEQIEYSGMIHGFMSFHMVLKEGLEAMDYIGDYLKGL